MGPDDEKAARKIFQKEDAAKALSEYDKEKMRFGDNRERLKAERLAREEAAALAKKENPAATTKKKRSSKQPSN